MKWRDKIIEKQITDFGLAAILVMAIIAFWQKEESLLIAIITLSLILIIVPEILSPFAFLWFGFSRLLSIVSSMILLTLLFFFIVTPMALIRRMLGKDNLKLRKFKRSKKSVFTDRDDLYGADSLTKSF